MFQLTDKNYKEFLNKSTTPVLIDFYADWCGPCKMLSPVLEKLAQQVTNVTFVKVDTDENPELTKFFGITAMPTMVLVDVMNELARMVGAAPEAKVRKFIESNV